MLPVPSPSPALSFSFPEVPTRAAQVSSTSNVIPEQTRLSFVNTYLNSSSLFNCTFALQRQQHISRWITIQARRIHFAKLLGRCCSLSDYSQPPSLNPPELPHPTRYLNAIIVDQAQTARTSLDGLVLYHYHCTLSVRDRQNELQIFRVQRYLSVEARTESVASLNEKARLGPRICVCASTPVETKSISHPLHVHQAPASIIEQSC